MSRVPRALLAAFACSYVAVAAAQGISDPTRPAPGWIPEDPAEKLKEEGKAPEGSGGEPVQLLLVGKTRRFAIVRGELVGEKTGSTKLVEVKRNDVVVSTERGKETLNLFPDVEKTAPRKRTGMGKKEQK